MDGEFSADFSGVQVHNLSQRKSVSVSHFGDEHLPCHRRDGAFHHTATGVDVVNDVERRRIVPKHDQVLHELQHVLGVVEVAHSNVLDFYNYGVQPGKFVGFKVYVVGAWGEFCFPGAENHFQVLPFLENVPHPPALCRIPTVLGTEAAHLAVKQGFVQLVL